MSIIGVTVGTPTSPKTIAREISPVFDLTALGNIQPNGDRATLETDTAEIMAALEAGSAKFSVTMLGQPLTIKPTVIKSVNPENPEQDIYLCSAVTDFEGVLLVGNLMITTGVMVAYFSTITAEEKPTATDIDLSAFESGQIVETYADGTIKTITLEFDTNGNPAKIIDGENITNITW